MIGKLIKSAVAGKLFKMALSKWNNRGTKKNSY